MYIETLPNFADRKSQYDQLINEDENDWERWYRSGLNDFKEGAANQSADLFKEAAQAMEKAYQLALKTDPQLATRLLRPLAIAQFYNASSPPLDATVQLLKKALDQQNDDQLLKTLGWLYFQNKKVEKGRCRCRDGKKRSGERRSSFLAGTMCREARGAGAQAKASAVHLSKYA